MRDASAQPCVPPRRTARKRANFNAIHVWAIGASPSACPRRFGAYPAALFLFYQLSLPPNLCRRATTDSTASPAVAFLSLAPPADETTRPQTVRLSGTASGADATRQELRDCLSMHGPRSPRRGRSTGLPEAVVPGAPHARTGVMPSAAHAHAGVVPVAPLEPLSSFATPAPFVAGAQPTGPEVVRELFVVYDADGTRTGELIYMTKKLLGLGHCAACDITHGPRREKPAFTALKPAWGVPLSNIHRDEMDAPLTAAVAARLPCVAARTDTRDILLLGNESLETCDGDVLRFRDLVDLALRVHNLAAPIAQVPWPLDEPMQLDALAQTEALPKTEFPARVVPALARERTTAPTPRLFAPPVPQMLTEPVPQPLGRPLQQAPFVPTPVFPAAVPTGPFDAPAPPASSPPGNQKKKWDWSPLTPARGGLDDDAVVPGLPTVQR